MATNYDINYNDKRFQEVESDKKQALTDLEKTYGGMISESDKYYQAQIDASKQWADKQSQIQQEKTDFAIEQIEQQKAQAGKDYTREQSGAYVDWQKESNRYGANAERFADQGLMNTGYSESSQVSMFNTYQNRVATARESYNQAILNYNNAIKDARLQNNAVLAEIAYNSLQQQLELSLQGFQYKNQLIIDKANKKTELDEQYYNRYKDVLNQMNTENALAEEVRQYNQNYALQLKQYNEEVRQFNKTHDLKVEEYNESIRQFNEEIKRLKAKDEQEHALEIKKLEQQKELAEAQLEEEQRQFNESLKASESSGGSSITKSSGGSSKSGGSSSSSHSSGSRSFGKGAEDPTNYAVSTPYYRGNLNSDAKKYGTFSNGYQPKGISGHGALEKTGDQINVQTQIKYGSGKGTKQNVLQNIWKAQDGTYWYWDGKGNKYIQIPFNKGGA